MFLFLVLMLSDRAKNSLQNCILSFYIELLKKNKITLTKKH